MLFEFAKSLKTKFYPAKGNNLVTHIGCLMQLPERHNCLAVILPVKCDSDTESIRRIILVRTVIHDQPFISNHLQVQESVREHVSIRRVHVKLRAESRTHIHLANFGGVAIWTKPICKLIR